MIEIRTRRSAVLALALIVVSLSLLALMANCERDDRRRPPPPPYNPSTGDHLWRLSGQLVIPQPGEVDVIMGDSTAETSYLAYPSRDGLLKRVSDEVCGMYCGSVGHASVLSMAKGGSHIADVIALLPSVLATPGVRNIWVLVGINDMGILSEQQFGAAYVQLVRTAQAAGVRVIPVEMLPIGSQRTDIEHGQNGHAGRVEMNGWIANYFGASAVVDTSLIKNPGNEWIDATYAQPNDSAHVHEGFLATPLIADVMAAAL